VLGGDADHLAERCLVPAWRSQHERLAADDLDGIVVGVVVRDEQEVGVHPLDRWVAELEAARGGAAQVAEGVDDDAVSVLKQERRLAVPADLHAAFSSVSGSATSRSPSCQWYLPPRSSEATAATRQAAIANTKA